MCVYDINMTDQIPILRKTKASINQPKPIHATVRTSPCAFLLSRFAFANARVSSSLRCFNCRGDRAALPPPAVSAAVEAAMADSTASISRCSWARRCVWVHALRMGRQCDTHTPPPHHHTHILLPPRPLPAAGHGLEALVVGGPELFPPEHQPDDARVLLCGGLCRCVGIGLGWV